MFAASSAYATDYTNLNACRVLNGSTCNCIATNPNTGNCTSWRGANMTIMPPQGTLTGVVFPDGGVAVGTIDFFKDIHTGATVYENIAIETKMGNDFPDTAYTVFNSSIETSDSFINLVTGTLADYTGTPLLQIMLSSPLSYSQEEVPVLSVQEGWCIDVSCTNGNFVRNTVSPSIPEPATATLLVAGLVGLGLARLRRTTRNCRLIR